VPKPSYEHGHLANEYKDRNGARGSVSKTDGFGVAGITHPQISIVRNPDVTGVISQIVVSGRLPRNNVLSNLLNLAEVELHE
jgi:hypothetical protein